METRLEVPIAAHLWLRNGRGEILFARRAGTGYADGMWSVPAGHVESGETFSAACAREAREEIGIELSERDLEFACVQQKLDDDGQERVDVFFWAELPEDAEPHNLEPDKCDALEWFELTNPPEQTIRYVGHALAGAISGRGPYLEFGYDR